MPSFSLDEKLVQLSRMSVAEDKQLGPGTTINGDGRSVVFKTASGTLTFRLARGANYRFEELKENEIFLVIPNSSPPQRSGRV